MVYYILQKSSSPLIHIPYTLKRDNENINKTFRFLTRFCLIYKMLSLTSTHKFNKYLSVRTHRCLGLNSTKLITIMYLSKCRYYNLGTKCFPCVHLGSGDKGLYDPIFSSKLWVLVKPGEVVKWGRLPCEMNNPEDLRSRSLSLGFQ